MGIKGIGAMKRREEGTCNAWCTLIRIWISSQGFPRGASGKESSALWWGVVRDGKMIHKRVKEEKYVYVWLIHADVWQKPTQHCKAIILQLKITKKNTHWWPVWCDITPGNHTYSHYGNCRSCWRLRETEFCFCFCFFHSW